MAVYKRGQKGTHWNYDFRVRGVRYNGKKPDDYVFPNPDTGKPFTDIKRSFHTACRMARIEGLWWHDLRATFCTRLALTGYEALTIIMLIGHGSEDDYAIHSCRPATEKCALSELWSQISHKRETAASDGSRKLLILLVGARGFEPPTSRSQTERTTRLCYAPKQ
jgi:hypothetical protein